MPSTRKNGMRKSMKKQQQKKQQQKRQQQKKQQRKSMKKGGARRRRTQRKVMKGGDIYTLGTAPMDITPKRIFDGLKKIDVDSLDTDPENNRVEVNNRDQIEDIKKKILDRYNTENDPTKKQEIVELVDKLKGKKIVKVAQEEDLVELYNSEYNLENEASSVEEDRIEANEEASPVAPTNGQETYVKVTYDKDSNKYTAQTGDRKSVV